MPVGQAASSMLTDGRIALKRLATEALGMRRKKKLVYWRARVAEACGSDRYSWPGLNGLDRRLVEALDFQREGVFIEAGANDGFAQSNTYYLERFLGWRGLLIEPIPELASLARVFRPNAQVHQVALGSPASHGSVLNLDVCDLMTSVRGHGVEANRRKRPGQAVVPCRTLASVIDDAGLDQVDLLSLDVEGYELEVLSGLDRATVCPRYVLVETARQEKVSRALATTHELIMALSFHDYLYGLR